MFLNKFQFYFFFFQILFCQILSAQEKRLTLEIEGNTILLSQPLVVSVIIKNQEDRPNCKFPEIAGFKKRGVSASSTAAIINGKTITDQKISQEYYAIKAGKYNISNISVKINDETLLGGPYVIVVSPSEKNDTEENFKDFIDGSASQLINVQDDAFFAVTTSKLKPYVGQGYMITVAFYIAQRNKAELQFVNENLQLEAILKKIRPKNCWEENLGISEIQSSKELKIEGKKYNQYKIYQAIYYPFNNQPIAIPALSWQMVKFKIAKDRAVSNEKEEDRKTYFSKPFIIKPIALPINKAFPTIFVGTYFLNEEIDKLKVQTGKSFKYDFKVSGTGNLDLLTLPEVFSDSLFEVFEPKVSKQNINKLGKQITEKTFSFDIVPKFAGNYSLKNHFFIHFFNPITKSYQELRAQKTIEVVGQAINDEPVPKSLNDDIYVGIDTLDNENYKFDLRKNIFNLANFLVVFMLLGLIYIIWPTKKK